MSAHVNLPACRNCDKTQQQFRRNGAHLALKVKLACLQAMHFKAAAGKHFSEVLGNEALDAQHQQ